MDYEVIQLINQRTGGGNMRPMEKHSIISSVKGRPEGSPLGRGTVGIRFLVSHVVEGHSYVLLLY